MKKKIFEDFLWIWQQSTSTIRKIERRNGENLNIDSHWLYHCLCHRSMCMSAKLCDVSAKFAKIKNRKFVNRICRWIDTRNMFDFFLGWSVSTKYLDSFISHRIASHHNTTHRIASHRIKSKIEGKLEGIHANYDCGCIVQQNCVHLRQYDTVCACLVHRFGNILTEISYYIETQFPPRSNYYKVELFWAISRSKTIFHLSQYTRKTQTNQKLFEIEYYRPSSRFQIDDMNVLFFFFFFSPLIHNMSSKWTPQLTVLYWISSCEWLAPLYYFTVGY